MVLKNQGPILLKTDMPCAPHVHRTRLEYAQGIGVGIDDFQSDRSPDRSYRTAPLRGLMTHVKGGFYHDGRFADLMTVVEHYNQFLKLRLTDAEKRDLIEYLKSL